MKASILHDDRGNIIAISKIGNLHGSGSRFTEVGMVPAAGQKLVEVQLVGEQEKRPLRDLHEHYRVDTSAKKLVKK
jgi:hypothetical protein